MRIRKTSSELCYAYREFKTLSATEICRHMAIGSEWLDQQRNKRASEIANADE